MNLAPCKVAYFQSVQFFFLTLVPKCLTIVYQAFSRAAEFYGNFQHPASDEYFCLLKGSCSTGRLPPSTARVYYQSIVGADCGGPQVFAYLVRSLWNTVIMIQQFLS